VFATHRITRQLRPLVRQLPLGLQRQLRALSRREISERANELGHGALSDPETGPHVSRVTASAASSVGTAEAPSAHRRSRPLAGSGTVILTYHRVDTDPIDPHFLVVDPKRFAKQLTRISRVAQPVPLHDVLCRSRVPRVAVTFDDGYADNVLNALPLLEAEGVPATVFVISDMVSAQREFWPDRLERLLRHAPNQVTHVELAVGGTTLTADVSDEAACRRTMWALHARLRPRPPVEIDNVLVNLERQMGVTETPTQCRPVTEEEVRRLTESKLVTVGAHTRSHPWLSTLSEAEQREEIVGCRHRLEVMTGRPVDMFAYPYGSFGSYGRPTVRILRSAGFTLACTTHSDPITRLTSRYLLPRRSVLDWDGDEFERRLRRWLDE
jgi:peptidoglycan/xylan/chitin deacetylase (PgdA/CDA1 family)